MRRAVVLAADLQDRDGALDVCQVAQPVRPRLERIAADAAYQGGLEEQIPEQYGWAREIVTKAPEQRGFAVHRWRWIVEGTFGWLGRNRRLSKDDEEFGETSEAWISAAMSRLMLRRLAA